LKGIAPERTGDLRFGLHPSVHLLRSAYPVDAICQAHQGGSEMEGELEFPSQDTCLLVARPGMVVKVLSLSVESFEFVTRLVAGDTLSQAFAATGGDWNPEHILSELLGFGAFVDFTLSEE